MTPSKQLYEQLARLGKAFASPARLELLDLLCQGPRTVEILAKEAGLSIANTSQHLRVLHGARMVESEKSGLFVNYRLADPAVGEFFQSLRSLGEKRLAEVDTILRRFREAPETLEPVEKETLLDRIQSGEVILLDVRPEEEYRSAHLPFAISAPLSDFDSVLSKLRRRKTVVAYCRGPYCVLAKEAVKILRAKGFRAVRLDDGVPEWRAKGLPVVVDHDFAGHI